MCSENRHNHSVWRFWNPVRLTQKRLNKMTRIPTVTEPVVEQLSPRKLTDYEGYEENLLRWLSRVGKNPQSEKVTPTKRSETPSIANTKSRWQP